MSNYISNVGYSGQQAINNTGLNSLYVDQIYINGFTPIVNLSVDPSSPLVLSTISPGFAQLGMTQASTVSSGWLSFTDFTSFNSRVLSVSAPLVKTGTNVSIPEATPSVDGYMSSVNANYLRRLISFTPRTVQGRVTFTGATTHVAAASSCSLIGVLGTPATYTPVTDEMYDVTTATAVGYTLYKLNSPGVTPCSFKLSAGVEQNYASPPGTWSQLPMFLLIPVASVAAVGGVRVRVATRTELSLSNISKFTPTTTLVTVPESNSAQSLSSQYRVPPVSAIYWEDTLPIRPDYGALQLCNFLRTEVNAAVVSPFGTSSYLIPIFGDYSLSGGYTNPFVIYDGGVVFTYATAPAATGDMTGTILREVTFWIE